MNHTQLGGIFNQSIDLKCEKTIYKISNSTFSYDKIDYDNTYIKSICELLDLGIKYVPILTDNYFNYFNNIYNDIDNNLLEFNRQVFINNIRLKNNNDQINRNNINKNININQIDDLYKNLRDKKTIKYDNIPLQHETIRFRFDLIKKVNLKKPMLNSNITKKQLEILHHFNKNKPFSIIQCDKNVGSLIISNENLDTLATNHLNGNDTYRLVDKSHRIAIFDKINETLNNLYANKDISNDLKKQLALTHINDYSIGKFRVLAKIHKKEFGIRPIINCGNNYTKKLCLFVHLVIHPYIQSINHILKDSQQLLQQLDNFKTSNELTLYSCDFESLYTNIQAEHAAQLITTHLFTETRILDNVNITFNGFKQILLLIFNCNLFIYCDKYYLQLIGLPMGCICGPSVANLFVYILEKKWLNLNPDIIYYRFIDDIFIAIFGNLNIVIFKSQFDYLKLNIESGNSVNFLDLDISFDKIIGRFRFSLFIKPTNTFSYLLPDSNHPKSIFRNIPLSLFKRIRRICSSYIDYLHFAKLLFIQLIKRGYNQEMLKGIIRNVGKISRESLLPYKSGSNNFLNSNSYNMFIEFDKNSYLYRHYLYEVYNDLSKELDIFKNHKLLIINKVKTNIGSLLIHGFKIKKSIKFSYNNCNLDNCNTCKYSIKYYYLKFKNFFLPLRSFSSCLSIGIIYIICCFKCKCFYIGESGRTTKDRINEHLRNIKNFKNDLIKSLVKANENSAVAEHFNLSNHDVHNDFRFLIFEENVTNNVIRKSIETDLINLFKLFNIKLLNNIIKQPNINKISYLTFQS